MKSKILFFMLGFFLISFSSAFSGSGTGTDENPYQITSWAQLSEIEDNLTASYILMNNLSSSTIGYNIYASPSANSGRGWIPIGDEGSSEHFEGNFYGKNHTIANLFMNNTLYDSGLFSSINNSKIYDLGVISVNITSNDTIGALTGSSYNSEIYNSYSTGDVHGTDEVGVGGLIGFSGHSNITNSYSEAYVSGVNNVGGLVGFTNDLSLIKGSYSTGDVTGEDQVGGLVGIGFNTVLGTLVNDSYSISDVVGNEDVGGLIGFILEQKIYNSYSTGNVSGNVNVGGLIGFGISSSVIDSFWDTNTSNQATSDGGTGKTTSQMKNIDTFSSWDIINIPVANVFSDIRYLWNIVSGSIYPFLSWQYPPLVIENSIIYDAEVIEGEINVISTNIAISSDKTITNAVLLFNGFNYSTNILYDGDTYLITSSNPAPLVDIDTNFTFNFVISVDGVDFNGTTNNQSVLDLDFGACTGSNNITLLNMSLFDEETSAVLIGDIEFNAEIVSKSSGIVIDTTENVFNNSHSAVICFSQTELYDLYNLNAEIKYSSDGYVPELYYIQSSNMADYPRNLSLFDLNQTDSTEFVVTFQNDAFIFVEGAILQLQRKYIGEDVYKTVEAPITADGGKAVVHIDLNTNIYRISVVKDGVLLKFFEEIVFSCENELAGECTESLRGDVDPNNDVPVETLLDFSYSVIVSDENNTVTVLFAVPSGTPSSINVLLTQIDMFGNLTACNTTVITSAGSITCGFSDTIEKSILQLTISKDGTQLAITNYGVDPKLDMDGMNFFIVFMFLISLVGMAIASPEWMMIIGIMVFMISGTLLLLTGMSLSMGLGSMAWLVVAVIIIILKMAKQEDR